MTGLNLFNDLTGWVSIANSILFAITFVCAIMAFSSSRKDKEKSPQIAAFLNLLYPGLGFIYVRDYIWGLIIIFLIAITIGYNMPLVFIINTFQIPTGWDVLDILTWIITPHRWVPHSYAYSDKYPVFFTIFMIILSMGAAYGTALKFNANLDYIDEFKDH